MDPYKYYDDSYRTENEELNKEHVYKILYCYFLRKLFKMHKRGNISIGGYIRNTIPTGTGLSYNAIKEGLASESVEDLRFLRKAFGPKGPPFVVNHTMVILHNHGGSEQYVRCSLCYESNVKKIILEPCKHHMCFQCLRHLRIWKCSHCDVDIQNFIVCP